MTSQANPLGLEFLTHYADVLIASHVLSHQVQLQIGGVQGGDEGSWQQAVQMHLVAQDHVVVGVEHPGLGRDLPLGLALLIEHVDHRFLEGRLLEDLEILGKLRLQPLGPLALFVEAGRDQILGGEVRLIVLHLGDRLGGQLDLAKLPGPQRHQKQQGKQQRLSVHREASGW
ncbi:hypothetical protein D3C85_1108500 [compost metagenome]